MCESWRIKEQTDYFVAQGAGHLLMLADLYKSVDRPLEGE